MLNKKSYIILDAARMEINLHSAQELNNECTSLYKSTIYENLADVGPYLFSFDKNTEFKNWYTDIGWGHAWGILIVTAVEFEHCAYHCKSFLTVKTEDNQELYFRFYDPRVLKIFLPTCDKNQILEFFGPIESFICEGDTKEEAIRFWHQNGELKQEILPVEKLFGNITTDVTPF